MHGFMGQLQQEAELAPDTGQPRCGHKAGLLDDNVTV